MDIDEKIQIQTKHLLNKSIEKSDIDKLIELINFYDRKYYADSLSVISDLEYDYLFEALKKIANKYPELVQNHWPTQRIGKPTSDDLTLVRHYAPMLSLDNSYNAADLVHFNKSIYDKIDKKIIQYTVEPKYDGASIALVYEQDILIRAATRGNGVEGEDITCNARAIRSIPLSVPFSDYGIDKIELRGEVVISSKAFNHLNQSRLNQGLSTFQNTRNTASGSLRLKDSKEVWERKLEAFIYQVGYVSYQDSVNVRLFQSHFQSIDFLHTVGFKVPKKERMLCNNITEAIDFCTQWTKKRVVYPYDIDGMVIKVDNTVIYDRIGTTAHHPRWAIAYKFKPQQAVSALLQVDFQVGRTGAITPVAKFKPVALAGVNISSVSLHNEDFIREKDIHLGDYLFIERAGDVIPYISGVDLNRRTKDVKPILFPRTCPVCASTLSKPIGERIWRCTYIDCQAQQEERLIHFVSKSAMNIDGLGKDIIKRFFHLGILSDILSLYQINYNDVLSLEGWQEKSVEKLIENIEKSKENPLWRLIVGLGIRHVGTSTAKMLSQQVDHLLDFTLWNEEQFLHLDDVGPKVAQTLVNYFGDKKNIGLISNLEKWGVDMKNKPSEIFTHRDFEGVSFVFTGRLEAMDRQEAKSIIEARGGKVLSSISSRLNYLVAGDNSGSKLVKARQYPGIKIVDEAIFLSMIKAANEL